MILDYEYALFTENDPISLLKDSAKKLSIGKKFKIAPYIRRAEALTKKSKKFRDLITDETIELNMLIGFTFAAYFGEKLDRFKYLSVPRDVTYEFVKYMNKSVTTKDDKYMRRVTALILSHSDSIDAFVKAFISIRLAQGELDKLRSS